MRRVLRGLSGRRLLLKRLVDRDARLRTFRGGHDGELHVPRRIADDVDAGDARLAEAIGLDRSLSRELASEPLREVGLLRLRARDECAVALHRVAGGQDARASTRPS